MVAAAVSGGCSCRRLWRQMVRRRPSAANHPLQPPMALRTNLEWEKEGTGRNLDLVEKLLSAAAAQPDGTLDEGAEAARETRFVGASGLAEVSLPEGEDVITPTHAIIRRVTVAGRKFLNVFATPFFM